MIAFFKRIIEWFKRSKKTTEPTYAGGLTFAETCQAFDTEINLRFGARKSLEEEIKRRHL